MAKMNFTSLQNRNAVKYERTLRYFSLPAWPAVLVVFLSGGSGMAETATGRECVPIAPGQCAGPQHKPNERI